MLIIQGSFASPPPGRTPAVSAYRTVLCFALVTQGIPPFQFALGTQPFQTQPDFTGLAGGTYKIYARNGVCLDSQMVTLVTPAQVVATVATLDEMCDNGNGAGRITITGGTAPYNILWSDGSTNTTLTGLVSR